ncbi:MAG: pyrroline-5-carboxylate reductase [Phycisphaerae bacterium]|nr:pyrroline-5-carboxylate reductase [Phycisphaerae bacterium]
MSRIGFIGAGNMAEALIRGIINSGLVKPADILISDLQTERLDELCAKYSVSRTENNGLLAGQVDTLILSVKPQNFSDVLKEIAIAIKEGTLLVSIAAGIKIKKITDSLGNVAVVRVMPNTPALIGEGMSALFANKKAKEKLDGAQKIFDAVGKTVIVENEELMDAVTAVSGSGPAYFFLMAEEMIKAGIELGLTPQQAAELVLQTAKGAAMLAIEKKQTESVADLRKKVTSPGGTTEAALKVLEECDFGNAMRSAVKKAADKSRELSR